MFVLSSDQLSFVPTQELVGLVKELIGEMSSLKGTHHVRRFNHLRDELKAYCHAIDFNDTVALNKLRATLDGARLSQADDTAKLSALWDRLMFTKQAGRHVDFRATDYTPPSNPGSIEGNAEPPRFSDVTKTTVEGVQPVRNAMLAVTLATSPRDCYKRWDQPAFKKPRTE